MVSKGLHLIDIETLTADLLGFLAAEENRFSRFLSLTGLQVERLRTAARTPGFAESLLDYVSSDEPLLLAFSAETGRDPREIATARQILAPPPYEG